MLTPIWNWFSINYPTAIVVAIIVIITFWVAWKLKGLYHRFKNTEIDCKKIGGEIIPKISTISTDIVTISSNLKSLVILLSSKDLGVEPSLFIAKSPIQLTDFGMTVLNAIGGKKFIDDNIEFLITLIEKENLKSALDVETHSKIVLIDLFDTDKFTVIKNYMYHNPIFKDGDKQTSLDMSTVTQVMSIYLRDKYFDKHPELRDFESK